MGLRLQRKNRWVPTPPLPLHCHPERSEGPAFSLNCHPERSEGPASVSVFRITAFALTFAALSLTACKPVGPNYQRPAYDAPPTYKESGAASVTVPPPPPTAPGATGWQTATPSDGMLKGKWWQIFNDPQLNTLEDRIAANNQSLHAAFETYQTAREQVRIARAGYYPTLSAGPNVSHDKLSLHRPLPIGSSGLNNYNDLQLEGQASWEPDFWGRIRRSVESAAAAAQASASDAANVELSLESELAEDYFELRGLDTQKELLDSDVQQLEGQIKLTKRRLSGGIGTGVDVAQAQTQLDTTRAQLIDVGIARTEFEHAIGSIAYLSLNNFSIAPYPLEMGAKTALPAIPTGLPSQLLQRRPDISAAERRVQQSNAQIGIAISAFYPNITLTGGGGFESTHVGTWFQGPAALWSLGGQASELLIDGGQRRAVTQQARDNFEAQAATYKNTVVVALQEVEDKLSDLRILEQEEDAERASVDDAQKSLNISNTRYKGGVTSYLEVITAETVLISNQRTEANLKSLQYSKTVELIRALGGGWDTTQLPK